MKEFGRGAAVGVVIVLTAVLVILVFRFFYNRDKRIYELMERQHEIQELR